MNQREHSQGYHISITCRNYFQVTIFSLISFRFYQKISYVYVYFLVLYNEIDLMLEKIYAKICENTSGSKNPETSRMEFFLTYFSGLKLLTIAREGMVLDMMWSLNSLLNEYLRFRSLINWPISFEILPRFWWYQQSIQHNYFQINISQINKYLMLFQWTGF